jgi:CBS domain containing-hemolysin-like protein
VIPSEVAWLPPFALCAAGCLFLIETALSIALVAASSLSRVALRRLGTEDGKRLEFLGDLRETASSHRIAAHLARQLCLLGGSLLLILALAAAGWGRPALVGTAIAAIVGVVVLELCVARFVSGRDPRRALRLTALPVRLAHAALYPVVRPIHVLLVKTGGIHAATEEQREEEQDEEVEALIEVGEREGLLEAEEGEMMRSIVDLDETAVREIMTPRPDVVALPLETSVDDARRVFLGTNHSRLPVYRHTLDEVVGILHVQDLLRASDGENGTARISDYMRNAIFVPETMSVAELLAQMRLRTQIAVVVDEYGATAGLVTLEDLLEEIVGEIRDEHERGEADVRRDDDGSWLINAGVHVDRLTELFGVGFDERDFDTVGGLVVSELGRVPHQGETLEFRALHIEVLEVDGRRIRLVRIVPQATGDVPRTGT